MLTTLQAHHDAVLAAIAELDAMTEGPAPDGDALRAARRRLGDAATALTRCLERQVFPALLDRLPADQAPPIRALQSGATGFRAFASTFVTVWPTAKAIANWQPYCSASRAMLQRARARVAQESALLYPLLAED